MDTFFPTPPLREGRDPDRAVRSRAGHDIGWPPLTKNEVERLFLRATLIKHQARTRSVSARRESYGQSSATTSYGYTTPHSNCSIRHASGRQQGSLHFGSQEKPITLYQRYSVRCHSFRQLAKGSRQLLLPGCPSSRRRTASFRVTTSELGRGGQPSRH
jgi:hypothetical protein